jgi:hypothetical protein
MSRNDTKIVVTHIRWLANAVFLLHTDFFYSSLRCAAVRCSQLPSNREIILSRGSRDPKKIHSVAIESSESKSIRSGVVLFNQNLVRRDYSCVTCLDSRGLAIGNVENTKQESPVKIQIIEKFRLTSLHFLMSTDCPFYCHYLHKIPFLTKN